MKSTSNNTFTISHLRLLSLISLFVWLSACSSSEWVKIPSSNQAATSDSGSSGSTYTWDSSDPTAVAPGFLVTISSRDAKVNGEFRVDMDHQLKLPYNVTVDTTGVSDSELPAKINQAYSSYFKTNEIQVDVIKKEYLLDVQGLVKKPGHYAFRHNASIDEVISQAGGLQESSDKERVNYVRIVGRNGTGLVRLADYHSGAKSVAPSWTGGEVLFFQTEGIDLSDASGRINGVVRVLGQVKNPAEYSVDSKSNFFSYLIKAGGPTDRADLGNVTIIRNGKEDTRAISVNTQDFESIPNIAAGDTIIVNADNPTQLEKKSRVGSNIANIITSIGIIAIAGM